MRSSVMSKIAVTFALIASAAVSAQTVSRQLAITPTSVNFGNVAIGSKLSTNLTITNTGNKSTNLKLPPSLTGSGFSCTGLPTTLAAGKTAIFAITFAPASPGNVTGTLSIDSTGSNVPASVALSGTGGGVAQLSSNPTNLSFGTVTVGTNSALPVIVTNTGTASATVSQYSASGVGFTISGPTMPFSLAPGQSTSVTVSFAPSTVGSATGTASVVSNASNSPTNISLIGTGGTAVGQLAASPASLNFGTVTVGTSTTLPVALSNTGTGSLTISQAGISGAGLSLSGLPLPLALSPGEGTSFKVVFAPTVAGVVSGTASLTSNASNSSVTVAIAATGGNQHSVSLSWTDTSLVAGYNIYRGTQSGGPYTRINSSLDGTKAYIDATVLSGQTYYYVTTAVSSTGAESAYSAPVQAVIPTP
jgi:hypothetical protein